MANIPILCKQTHDLRSMRKSIFINLIRCQSILINEHISDWETSNQKNHHTNILIQNS